MLVSFGSFGTSSSQIIDRAANALDHAVSRFRPISGILQYALCDEAKAILLG